MASLTSVLAGKSLVKGKASGELIFSDMPISFMGGVDAASGTISDTHHPLQGSSIAGKILAIPSGRGSCGASVIIFELLFNGLAPAGLIFEHEEKILTLGVMIAEEILGRSIPVVCLGESFQQLASIQQVAMEDGSIVCNPSIAHPVTAAVTPNQAAEIDLTNFNLTPSDKEMLSGAAGEAARIAMRIVLRAAALDGVNTLIDITQAHIDGSFYAGPGSVAFVERLCELGGKVKVPSSINALSVDKRKWRAQGIAEIVGTSSERIADAYVRMGVTPTYTCAPYLLDTAPKQGEQIVWAESNAVVFANSVLGARTMKYPDYLDILIAITGRAPQVDCHLDENRLPTKVFQLSAEIHNVDDAFYPALGYLLGKLSTNDIPLILGLETFAVNHDDLKAFGAAFATTSAVAMFHILGVTPEAEQASQLLPVKQLPIQIIEKQHLLDIWQELNSATDPRVDLVALGNPHFSLSECLQLDALCKDQTQPFKVPVKVTCGRHVYEHAAQKGVVDRLSALGVSFITDTCWCLIGEPIIQPEAKCIMTNSGKYAHYGTAATGKGLHFGSLLQCIEAAKRGHIENPLPAWVS